MDAPVGRRSELGAIDQRVLDEAITVNTFGEWYPWQVSRTGPHGECRIELRLQVGLLHIDQYVLARLPGGLIYRVVRIVTEVGRDVRREDVVKLVVDADVEAL